MKRSIVTVVVTMLGAGLFGYAMAGLPTPDDPAVFWIGNFSAPWAVLAFLVGWSQRRPIPAMLVAVVAEIACVAGFYGHGPYFDPLNLGLPPDTPPVTIVLVRAGQLLSFARQWLIAGIGAGIVYGYLGAWWARSRSLVPTILLALPFFVEPLAWLAYLGRLQGPATVWLCEALVGIGLLAVMAIVSRRQPVRGTA